MEQTETGREAQRRWNWLSIFDVDSPINGVEPPCSAITALAWLSYIRPKKLSCHDIGTSELINSFHKKCWLHDCVPLGPVLQMHWVHCRQPPTSCIWRRPFAISFFQRCCISNVFQHTPRAECNKLNYRNKWTAGNGLAVTGNECETHLFALDNHSV